MSSKSLVDWCASELRALEEARTLKKERVLEGPTGARVRVDGRDVLMLTSNNYLGFANHPRVREAQKKAIDRWGAGMASVRFICGTEDLHKQLEAEIARFFGTDDAVLYMSCWNANEGLFAAVLDEPDGHAENADSRESLRPLHILLVDDDPLVRKSVVAQLNTQAHVVETASNGREGLDRFASGRFDLVVTDRAMPEMGGDQLAATIERSAPETPVIMLTGFGDLMSAKGEHPVGVDSVVSKPVTLDALTQAILKVIARR